jgi:hypothetical protein
MGSRCNLHPTADDGKPATLVACCRVAGHAGNCHGHFSAVVYGREPHRLLMRTTGQQLVCPDGAALDGAS